VNYKNIDALRQATVMDLILVDEIKIAKSVLSFLIMKKIKSSLTD
jgi:hypothetical protein